MDSIKVGDIIDGRIVTKVFSLCGSIAYQSEPLGENKERTISATLPLKATLEKIAEKPKARGRKRKE